MMPRSKRRATSPSHDPIERIYIPPALPARPTSGHKGLFGRVLVVGGNAQMFGAATLAATAALRCGSGLVQVAVPIETLPFALSITPELIGLGLRDQLKSKDRAELRAAADAADVVVVGPGMGQSREAVERLKFLCEFDKPMVIDADALNVFAAMRTKWWKRVKSPAVLTPHPGEMARLSSALNLKKTEVPTDDTGRHERAVLAARTFKQIVLLKGHRTLITDGVRAYVNQTGDSSLSKAGTGDVLSGVIGSLIGQGMTAFDAACAGAWIHGKAGELAGEKLGARSVLAREVIENLGAALREYPNCE